ncbi:carboxypeptidase regulatory-like domain-containing protein [Priestia abyssalis]|uniref:carboxypeptidase regulatory-like domain-containing protein n=1 Tax=Priestia abyssalis TaxID=1221450 RepID=UPI0014730307|nr:carboxypeptidase regulatory-like domain-containing protein [Priestia abyssalis]
MPFPSNTQYTPILVNGVPLFDTTGDESPAATDIVGNSTSPAGFFAYDGINVYFRLRLNADPRNSKLTGFDNFAWGVLINTSGVPGTYDWLFNVNGLNNTVNLIQNTNKLVNSWNDPAEGTGGGNPNFSQPITNYDFARITQADSNFGGNPDYFLDWFLPASTVFSFLNITESSLIRAIYFTSTNANNFNKDSLRAVEGFSFANALSEPASSGEVDVRAQLRTDKILTSGPTSVLLGQTATWTGMMTVSNTGLSQATTIFASDVVGLDFVSSFVVNSASQGLTTYNSSNRTLTWNVGNLNPSITATLTFTVTGSFTNDEQNAEYLLDRVKATGFDSFTGKGIQSNTSTVNIDVQRAATISGTIINQSNGTVVPGANVTLLQNGNPVAVTTSNVSGFYSFTNVTPGSYTISVSNSPNFLPASVNVTVASGQSLTQNIFLTPAPSTIQGTVTGNSNPVQNATVTLTNNLGAVIAQTTTNALGGYSFTNVIPGPYTVTVMAPTFQSQTQGVITQPGQASTVNFVLQPNPGAITGMVTNDVTSAPIPGATVELLTNQGIFLDSTVTNGSGTYMFSGLAPGQYQVRASAVNFGTNTVGATVISNATTITNIPLQPNPGRITGTLTDSLTGTGISGATVQLINSSGTVVNTTITNGNGTYLFESVVPGSYSVVFTANGYSSSTVGAIVNSNQTTVINAALSRMAGALSGTVVNNSNVGIEGAQVTVFQNNIPVATAVTDSNGDYLIPNLASGDYVVVASAENFAAQTLAAMIIDGQITLLNFTLQPNPGTLTGQVTDSNGTPIIGATVSVQLSTGTGIIIASAVTDSNGIYTIPGLSSGTYTVNATAPNFQTAISGAVISPNATTTVNFALAPNPGAITGQITDAQTGTPIAGANVEVRVVDSSGAIVATVFSDPNGQYLVNQLAPGSYTLIISAGNFQTAAVSEMVVSGQTSTANVSLSPSPGSITGPVLNSQGGTPIPGAAVNVVNSQGALITTVLTSEDGTFVVNGLPPDQYTLTIFADNFQNGTVGAFVQSNVTTPVTVSLVPQPGQITGTVNPVVTGTVARLLDNNGRFIDSAVTNPDGAFQFSNLAPGSYTVSATAPGFGTTNAGVTVVANQSSSVSLDLVPNPGTVSGVITSSNGQPLANALVHITDSTGTVIGFAFTDVQGQYTITNIPAGSYTLKASAENFIPSFVGVVLNPGQDLTGVNLSLEASPGSINGQITSSQTGAPIGGATVVVRDAVTQTILAAATTTIFGNYTINNLPLGPVTVTASGAGFGSTTIGALITSNQTTTADIALSPNRGAISGTVLDTDGNPVTGNNIQVQIFNENKVLVTSVLANSDGTYTISGLPPGNYFVTVTAPGFSASTVSAQVTSDTTTNVVNVVTPDPVTLTVTVQNSATEAPIAGANVSVRQQNGIIVGTGVTDSNGQFVFTNLPAGSLAITADASNFGTDSMSVFADRGAVLNTTLSLSPNPGNLNGFVSNIVNGDPIPNAVVQLFDFTNTLVQAAVSDQFGQYSFSGISPGTYTVVANAADFGQQSAGAIISSNQTSTLSFALTPNPGIIQGFVTNSLTGTPIQGATVLVRELSGTGPIVYTTITDESGFYQTTTLAPLVYVLVASEPNFSSASVSAQVISNTVQQVDFQLTSNPGGVQGTVADASTGVPLVNTLVRVLDSQGVIVGSIQTDMEGGYVITGLAPGNYTVTAINLDYQPQIQNIEVVPNVIKNLNFALIGSPATLQGTVTDAVSGIPLVGAIVQIFKEGTEVLLRRVLTNENGFYIADGLPAGAVRVIVSFDQYANSVHNVILGPNETETLNVLLNPFLAAITGTVTDAVTFSPIGGALVQLVIPNTEIVVASILTEPAGSYMLPNLPQGSYTIVFSADNYQTKTVPVILTPGETETVNASLDTFPAAVRGTVTNALTGNLIPNVLIQAFTLEGAFLGSAFSDITGNYVLTGLPQGTISLIASTDGFSSQTLPVTLAPGEEETVTFQLTPNPATLRGRVTNAADNNPIEGVLVQVFIPGTVVPVKTILTDPNGDYVITGLGEGEYRVVFSTDNFSTEVFRIMLAPNEVRTLNAQLTPNPATIRGQVTDAATGLPIQQAGVVTVIQGTGIIVASAQTDQNGQYVLTGLALGSYNVVFSAPEYVTQTVPVILASGEVEVVNTALVGNPAQINGTVRNAATGAVLPNALIRVFDLQGSLIGGTLTDMNGQYTISGLAQGTYSVTALAEGHASQTMVITLTPGEEETVNFQLPPNPARLRGTVTDERTGQPISGVLVQVFFVGSTVPVRSTITDPMGRYLLNGLSEGEYRIEFSKENYITEVFRVVLAPDEDRILNVQLASNPAVIQGTVRDAETGQPIVRANVIVSITGTGIIVASILTDSQGRYRLTGIAPGDYTVSFSADGYASQTSDITLAAGQSLTLNANLLSNPAILTGTVLSGRTGDPIEGGVIRVFSSDGQFITSTLTDENGEYTIPRLNSGTYTVSAVAFGFESEIQTVTLVRGTTTELNFVLDDQPASLVGRVTDARTNQPIEGAVVQVYPLGSSVPIRSTVTLPDGSYIIIGLPPGSYRVIANTPNYLPAEFTITLEAGETLVLNIELTQRFSNLGLQCIEADKVYDWIVIKTRERASISYPCDGDNEDCCREFVREAIMNGDTIKVECKAVGNPSYTITNIMNGNPGRITIQWFLHLMITIRNTSLNRIICQFDETLLMEEEVIVCLPSPLGADNIKVNIHQTFCERENTIFGNQFFVNAIICADIKIKAKVVMDVIGPFCTPRRGLSTNDWS